MKYVASPRGALRTFARRYTYLKRTTFDNEIGYLRLYHEISAVKTVRVVRNTFKKVETLRHVVIEWIPHEDSEE